MIVLLGMAGAGKSTQCQRLAQGGAFQWLAVGALLRSKEKGTERAEMMMGKVLDDALVTPMLQKEIQRMGDTPEILLDGCPRTVEQARWLASHTDTPAVRKVLHLVLPDDVAVARLMNRKREDDTEFAIRTRLEGYHRDIEPVLSVFARAGIEVRTVSADGTEEKIFEDLCEALK